LETENIKIREPQEESQVTVLLKWLRLAQEIFFSSD